MVVALVALLTAVLMEPYSAWVHRVLWHGPLWFIHRAHHRTRLNLEPTADVSAHAGLDRNDWLSASHAPVSIALALVWWFGAGIFAQVALGLSVGMMVYGALYVLVHDGVVHGRLPVRFLLRFGIFERMRAAHARHHRSNAAPYGFFASPFV